MEVRQFLVFFRNVHFVMKQMTIWYIQDVGGSSMSTRVVGYGSIPLDGPIQLLLGPDSAVQLLV